MRLAVIDMGTNTFNLLIAQVNSDDFEVLYSTKNPVKLGQKIIDNHVIDEAGTKRIMNVLSEYSDTIKKYNVHQTIAVATSSIRTAKNKLDILNKIKTEFKIDVQLIDGEREAELIYKANQHAIQSCTINDDKSNYLIMDIGGGSTEFIIANNKTAWWKKSFLLGMARLIDEIKPSDPIQTNDITRIHQYLDEVLRPLHEKIQTYQPAILVGSSGVFDSVVEMIEANLRPVHKTKSCCEVSISDFNFIYQKLLPLSYQERLNFKGLIEMRADMIVVSLILIDYVLRKYSLNQMLVSFYSLKEGIVIEKMRENGKKN